MSNLKNKLQKIASNEEFESVIQLIENALKQNSDVKLCEDYRGNESGWIAFSYKGLGYSMNIKKDSPYDDNYGINKESQNNQIKKLANSIICIKAYADNFYDYEYYFTGITNEELKNNYEAHKNEIKKALIDFTLNALPTNKDDLLDYWVSSDNIGLSKESLEKVKNDTKYENNNILIWNDFKDEIIKNVTDGINMLCDEGNEGFIGEGIKTRFDY